MKKLLLVAFLVYGALFFGLCEYSRHLEVVWKP